MTDSKLHHYLLDTNIISELIRYKAESNVLEKMVEHSSDCAMSVFSLQEMLYGAERLDSQDKKKYLLEFIENDVLENFPLIEYGEKASRIHARILTKTRRTGKTVSFDDSFIAAVALANNMTLVTRNTKHFESIVELFGLKVENWFEK